MRNIQSILAGYQEERPLPLVWFCFRKEVGNISNVLVSGKLKAIKECEFPILGL